MKVCVMKAVRCIPGHGEEFLGIVIGRTLKQVKRKAARKWHWYGFKDPTTRYYAGYPETRTSWMNLD